MSNHVLTISRDYQPNWNERQALRELISNGLDAQTRNPLNSFSYSHSVKDQRLTLRTEGVKLPLKVLMMGESESRKDPNCIGQFGEGLTLALLVLARMNWPVKITNSDESWTPTIQWNEDFQSNVLNVATRQLKVDRRAFIVEVSDISEEMFINQIQPMFLPERVAQHKTPRGSILTGAEYQGSVFINGVLIRKGFQACYGYNFSGDSLALNRDRDLVDITALHSSIYDVYQYVSDPELLRKVARAFVTQQECLEVSSDISTSAFDAVLKGEFETQWPNALPYHDEGDRERIVEAGLTPVFMNWNRAYRLRSLLGASVRCAQASTEIVADVTDEAFAASAYNAERLISLHTGLKHVASRYKMGSPESALVAPIRVVRFKSKRVKGLWASSGATSQIYISEDVFDGPEHELVNVVIHEATHAAGADGSTGHFEAQLDLASKYIEYLRN